VRRTLILVSALFAWSAAVFASAPAASASGTWTWPVSGPVIRPFDPPDSPYGSGHRGIDIGADVGTTVEAAAPGIVSFAGPVGGELFVSVDHGAGVVSSYSYLAASDVRKGDVVAGGALIGHSGAGHPGIAPPHLHFGVRVDGAYVDPLLYLSPPSLVSLIALAPLDA
jgi:murein DD-endopeptidase MepM/ murein hydrolase activator NlpD